MRGLKKADLEGRIQRSIHIGDIFASRRPAVVRTVLGSCISVCLRDPIVRVGGMNHFMLPTGSRDEGVSARYGVHAMELLINACMRKGAERQRLEAKVFGGGHVLRIRESDGNVPQHNIRFALDFLETENIPIISRDLGGYTPRDIYFFTDSGRILLKRLSSVQPAVQKALNADLETMEREERAALAAGSRPVAFDNSNITLF